MISLPYRTVRGSPVCLCASIDGQNLLLLPDSVLALRHQTRSQWTVLREYDSGTIRQGLAGGVGWSEKTEVISTIRVCIFNRGNCFEIFFDLSIRVTLIYNLTINLKMQTRLSNLLIHHCFLVLVNLVCRYVSNSVPIVHRYAIKKNGNFNITSYFNKRNFTIVPSKPSNPPPPPFLKGVSGTMTMRRQHLNLPWLLQTWMLFSWTLEVSFFKKNIYI